MTAKALHAICPEFSAAMLSNVLSWMDLRYLVEKHREDGRVLWALLPPPKRMVIPPFCPACKGQWNNADPQTCVKCGRTALRYATPEP